MQSAHGLPITRPPICSDLGGRSPRPVSARPGPLMTHLIFLGDNLGTVAADDTSYTQVGTTDPC